MQFTKQLLRLTKIHNMASLLQLPIVITVLLMCTFMPGISLQAADEPISITELTAITTEQNILLFATVQNGFKEKMIESLQSGINVYYSFYLEVSKITPDWPDELITSSSFKHSINYDTLRDDYLVTLEEKNDKVVRLPSLLDAQKVLERINGVAAIAIAQLIPGQKYQIRLRAELTQKTIPLAIHKILPLFTAKDIKTKWQYLDFSF